MVSVRLRERGADVRGHVVRAFGGVPVMARVLRHKALEEIVEIGDHVGVGILLNHQRRGGVLEEDGQQAGADLLRAQASASTSRVKS